MPTVENFIKTIEKIKEKDTLDLTLEEDLSIALMNLISLEEHLLFSFWRTSEKKYLEFLEVVREARKKLLARIVKKDDGSEKWCISKHLLATSMRLMEVGTKSLHEGRQKEAEEFFEQAFEFYSLFWAVNGFRGGNNAKIKIENTGASKISKFVKKILDCCRE